MDMGHALGTVQFGPVEYMETAGQTLALLFRTSLPHANRGGGLFVLSHPF